MKWPVSSELPASYPLPVLMVVLKQDLTEEPGLEGKVVCRLLKQQEEQF